MQVRRDRYGGNHAENAVIFAGIGHGIEMRAEYQRRQTRFTAFKPADQVACLIDMRAHAALLHPAGDKPVCLRHLRRQVVPFDAVLHAGEPGKLVASGEDCL